MKRHRTSGFLCLMGLFLFACTAPATRMKCSEIRFRMNQEGLGPEQREFVERELEDCELRWKTAKQRDSLALNRLEQRLSPGRKGHEDSL